MIRTLRFPRLTFFDRLVELDVKMTAGIFTLRPIQGHIFSHLHVPVYQSDPCFACRFKVYNTHRVAMALKRVKQAKRWLEYSVFCF